MIGIGRLVLAAVLLVGAKGGTPLLIDDFSREDERSALGTEWRDFTDRVMGGRSQGEARRDTLDGRSCLHLRGEVSLAHGGGFIQVAVPLESGGKALDASAYTGIRLVVRASGEGYYLHLRTGDTWLPWHHYRAPIPSGEAGWREVSVPFAAFEPQGLMKPLAPSKLERLGIVAAKREFSADIAVARIDLYR